MPEFRRENNQKYLFKETVAKLPSSGKTMKIWHLFVKIAKS